jgi:hypothetical protein
VIVRAHLRLGKSKVTATDWVGRVFEIIGPDLPEVMRIESTVITEFLGLVNRYVLQNAAGFSFVNGYGVASRVRKQFNRPPEVIHNVRIRRPGQPTGSDYVDRGHLNRNADDQALFVSSEYKTRGAAGDLTPQTSRRDERLFGVPHPPGTELVYQMKGRSGTSSIDLDDIILASGKHSPAILREAAVFSRIGVRAGTRFGARVAKDQHGDPYIRIVVPCATDPMRRLLEKLLRDRTWQK